MGRRKISTSLKNKAVKEYMFTTKTLKEVAKEYNVSPDSVRKWAEKEKSAMARTSYPLDFKKKVVKWKAENNATILATHKRFGISTNTILDWCDTILYCNKAKKEEKKQEKTIAFIKVNAINGYWGYA